jgi:hypothetical protein
MKTYRFTAQIQSVEPAGAGIVVPFEVESEFGAKGRVAVKATFNGVPYAGSLMKCGPGAHMLGILKSIQQQIGKRPGDSVEVVLWKDDGERTVEVPAEFQALLTKEGLLGDFEKLSYTHRKEYCRWITEAKKEETRASRLTKSIALLKKGVKTPG